jgi:hypothetical protein
MYFAIRRFNPRVHWVIFVSLAATLAFLNVAAFAGEAPYNPSHLTAVQATEVGQICQTVMGFRPSGALNENLWPGNPDPASSTNEYRGCVASLSRSIQTTAAARVAMQAEQTCRAEGLQPGSPELALCALRTVEASQSPARGPFASLSVTPSGAQATADSTDSDLAMRRKRMACAAIGLTPSDPAFGSCVEGLTKVTLAKFMEDAYRN